ncbi:hypothetical protein GCM10010112_18510 [Actinoplanes lobatus]|uniref:Protein kinase domain-containing protein n=1 Tax=Actinoplanes lobatus TaxID=113568 RepID=A0A7W7MDV9_9ACTN|nr:molecular chaperone DnaJ [Actinoplanes lobatus]MBB4746190.1 hypothetical protein [Actinoplanes lobatus]GGN61386.1 hypothetical protein GCM10010112_18510 [Actinoplanes lobatus]GIE41398.1 hypothetical protein Alo02nite_42960 [Actinoplanes lobatus]
MSGFRGTGVTDHPRTASAATGWPSTVKTREPEIGFDEAVARIMTAASFGDLLNGAGDSGTGRNRAGYAYKKWAKLVHPDAVSAGRRATATDAFARLSALYKQKSEAPVLHGRRRAYRMGEVFAHGDLAELYADGQAVIKIPRHPGDSDLMEVEAATLQRLWRDGDPRFRPYAARLVESFVYEDERRCRRRVNVLERQDGMVSLAHVKEATPQEVLWIWRRLLTGLGWAHRAGVTHGALLEEHVLIHREMRGLVIIDWCYAGHRPRAIVKARQSAYPPEVLNDRLAGPATDIYMATGLITRLMGSRMPEPLRRFAAGCTYDAPRMRPQDAWALLGELDDIIPQRYRN